MSGWPVFACLGLLNCVEASRKWREGEEEEGGTLGGAGGWGGACIGGGGTGDQMIKYCYSIVAVRPA